MKYKLVVKTDTNTYVKARSKNKLHLESIALKLSAKNPNAKFFIVNENFKV